MYAKSILIPLAAFAVTVTGVSAFNSDVLQSAGLTDDQIAAFEEAKGLRESGDKDGARDVLVNAGITETEMQKVREAMKEYRDEHKDAVMEAVENNDYDAFKAAVAGSPMADVVTSKADFERFVEAHELMESGDREAGKEIMDDLGLIPPRGPHMGMGEGPRDIEDAPFWDDLSASEQADVKAAIEAKDHDKVKEILESAGVDLPDRGMMGRGHHGMMDDDEDDD